MGAVNIVYLLSGQAREEVLDALKNTLVTYVC